MCEPPCVRCRSSSHAFGAAKRRYVCSSTPWEFVCPDIAPIFPISVGEIRRAAASGFDAHGNACRPLTQTAKDRTDRLGRCASAYAHVRKNAASFSGWRNVAFLHFAFLLGSPRFSFCSFLSRRGFCDFYHRIHSRISRVTDRISRVELFTCRLCVVLNSRLCFSVNRSIIFNYPWLSPDFRLYYACTRISWILGIRCAYLHDIWELLRININITDRTLKPGRISTAADNIETGGNNAVE